MNLNLVNAKSGCCSHHGGVAYCASNGRYVCNDETYSPTCTCVSYSPPVVSIPEIPSNTNGNFKYIQNTNGGADLYFDWDRPDGKSYSIALSKKAGANPGPLTDTLKSEYIFQNITPGIWYINLKEMMDNQWSQVTYWTVEVPIDVKQKALPLSTPTPLPTPTPKTNTNNISNETSMKKNETMSLSTALFLTLGVPVAIAFLGKKR